MGLPNPRKLLKNINPRQAEESEEYEEDLQERNLDEAHSASAGDDVLQQYGIAAVTNPPTDVFSPQEFKSVRFRKSQPEGYHFPDVDAAAAKTLKSLEWFTKTLHRRDLDVHRLATEIDQLNQALTDARYNLEIYSARRDKVLVDEDGNPIGANELEGRYLRNKSQLDSLLQEHSSLQAQHDELAAWASQASDELEAYRAGNTPPESTLDDEKIDALVHAKDAEIAALTQQLEAAQNSLQQVNGEVQEGPLTDEERNHLNALSAWAEEVQVLYGNMEKDLETERQRVASLEDDNNVLKQQLEVLASNQPSVDSDVLDISSTETAELHEKIAALEAQLEETRNYANQMETYTNELNEYVDQLEQAAGAVADGATANLDDQQLSETETEESHSEQGQELLHEDVLQPAPEHQEDDVLVPVASADEYTEDEDVLMPVSSAPEETDEDGLDDFDRMLEDLRTPEVAHDRLDQLRSRRPMFEYAPAAPGTPARSIPPGEEHKYL